MVKILVINCGIHEKNRQGLARILNYLQNQGQIKYHIGTMNEIPNYDIIYSPSHVINTSLYPNKKFIFGPHFSTFPSESQMQSLQNHVHHNSIYIQPSEWVVQLWKNMGAENFLPIKSFPFPVDTERFKSAIQESNATIEPNEIEPNKIEPKQKQKNDVFVYYKHRNPNELNFLKEFLKKQNITNYKLFDYKQRYNEDDYLSYLQQCKYGIILDAHESQGFAIEEALACDVPLLVWNAQTMNQEYNSQYHPIPCTSIPYWNEQCGEYFHHHEELERKFQTFQTRLATQTYYNPIQYILDNLSMEKCAERFMELTN